MVSFVSHQYKAKLRDFQFDNFDSIWATEMEWFEEPNYRRGGWSGVGRLEFAREGQAPFCVFVKKQQNHGRWTMMRPFAGEPTFKRESERLIFLEKHHFAAPIVLFYGESSAGSDQQAVLVTLALDEYQSLEEVFKNWWPTADINQQQKLIELVAVELKRFHDLGLVHRALYPKHIFIKNIDHHAEIALIDLEKSRFTFFKSYRAFFDLAALNRHSKDLSLTQRIRFFKSYLGVKKLNVLNKVLCRLIANRSAR
jgi:hypothetical protein